ncbi:MAG: lipoate--protein ligase, partial [Parabacteroides sp.]|nr:lipoate--protein ligase [Parabacteroides sp.]
MSGFTYHDLGRIGYEEALAVQTSAFNSLLNAKAEQRVEENHLFFCEHEPVLTIGKSGKDSNLLISEEMLAK